jgi:hypothetical protein
MTDRKSEPLCFKVFRRAHACEACSGARSAAPTTFGADHGEADDESKFIPSVQLI